MNSTLKSRISGADSALLGYCAGELLVFTALALNLSKHTQAHLSSFEEPSKEPSNFKVRLRIPRWYYRPLLRWNRITF